MTERLDKEPGGGREQRVAAPNRVWRAQGGFAGDLPALADSVGFLVRIVQLQSFQLFYRRLDGAGLSIGAMTTLGAIHANPGIRHGVLADSLMIKRPNFTKVINLLEQAGLITREAADSDKRTTALFITRKGVRKLEAMQTALLHYHDEMTAILSPVERDLMIGLLHRVSQHLQSLLDAGHAAPREAAAADRAL